MFLQGQDNTHSEVVTCPHCGQEFECLEYEGQPGFVDVELVYCPHDGCRKFVEERRSSGSFSTRRLRTPEER